MIYVGIDVAKSKHDCYIVDSDGVVHTDSLTISNDRQGFNKLLETILNALDGDSIQNAKVGLEHTGHYSINIKRFLESQGFVVTSFNPLETNAFRKASTLRKTKTDKCDAKTIATMLFSDDSVPTLTPSYQLQELKSLTRHRFRLIGYRGKLKVPLLESSMLYSQNSRTLSGLSIRNPVISCSWNFQLLMRLPDATLPDSPT